MANIEQTGGVGSFYLYGEESTEGTAASTIASQLGLHRSIRWGISRNFTESRGMQGTVAGRKPAQQIPGLTTYTLSTEFQVTDFAFLKYVLGSVSGAGTGASKFSYTVASTATPVTISANIDNVTTDRNITFLGCKPNACSIRFAVGEPITANIDWTAAKMTKSATIESKQSLSSNAVYNFAGADFEAPNATDFDQIVDNMEISFTNNNEVLPSNNSTEGSKTILKNWQCDVNFTTKYVDEDWIERVMGNSTSIADAPTQLATVGISFDAGTNRNVDFVFSNVDIENLNQNDSIGEILTEDFVLKPRDVTVSEQTQA